MSNRFKVGDIVICHSGTRSNGKKGFIEEIVRDNLENRGTAFQAMYSIYGLKPAKIHRDNEDSPADYYFGDHVEDELESTGQVMTREQLIKFKSNLKGGFASDIDIVILNLGREKGRNIKPKQIVD